MHCGGVDHFVAAIAHDVDHAVGPRFRPCHSVRGSRPETTLIPFLWPSFGEHALHRIRRMIPARLRRFFNARMVELIHEETRSFASVRRWSATVESMQYADLHMRDVPRFPDRGQVLEYALAQAVKPGLYLEFGVWTGDSINLIAKHAEIVHGFDSFRGLPEDWEGMHKRGDFDLRGRMPRVRANVRLHVGWFDQTLPVFLNENRGDAAFIHIDCDIYSSAKTVLARLADRIGSGCVIVFDEYFCYPDWQLHEFKAFQELVREKALRYRYIAYSDTAGSAAVLVE